MLVLRRHAPAPSDEGAGAVYRRAWRCRRRDPVRRARLPVPAGCCAGTRVSIRTARRRADLHGSDATRRARVQSRSLPFASHRLETRLCPGATARSRGHPARQASASACRDSIAARLKSAGYLAAPSSAPTRPAEPPRLTDDGDGSARLRDGGDDAVRGEGIRSKPTTRPMSSRRFTLVPASASSTRTATRRPPSSAPNFINDIAAGKVELPTIPAVVQKLMAALRTPTSTRARSASRSPKDPILSAKVLRLANSSFFGGQRSMASIDAAVSLIGIQALTRLIVACGVAGSFKDIPGIDMAVFWRDSLLAATAANKIAPRLEADPEAAYVCGLLHATGHLILCQTYPEIADLVFTGYEVAARRRAGVDRERQLRHRPPRGRRDLDRELRLSSARRRHHPQGRPARRGHRRRSSTTRCAPRARWPWRPAARTMSTPRTRACRPTSARSSAAPTASPTAPSTSSTSSSGRPSRRSSRSTSIETSMQTSMQTLIQTSIETSMQTSIQTSTI